MVLGNILIAVAEQSVSCIELYVSVALHLTNEQTFVIATRFYDVLSSVEMERCIGFTFHAHHLDAYLSFRQISEMAF